jgi:hypothetical protein
VEDDACGGAEGDEVGLLDLPSEQQDEGAGTDKGRFPVGDGLAGQDGDGSGDGAGGGGSCAGYERFDLLAGAVADEPPAAR